MDITAWNTIRVKCSVILSTLAMFYQEDMSRSKHVLAVSRSYFSHEHRTAVTTQLFINNIKFCLWTLCWWLIVFLCSMALLIQTKFLQWEMNKGHFDFDYMLLFKNTKQKQTNNHLHNGLTFKWSAHNTRKIIWFDLIVLFRTKNNNDNHLASIKYMQINELKIQHCLSLAAQGCIWAACF